MEAPRLLIGGVSSGVGKTTFTLGLCAGLFDQSLIFQRQREAVGDNFCGF